jgi:hypothetical protein
MAEQEDSAPVLPSGESMTPTTSTAIPALPVVTGVQPGGLANDAQEAIQQLEKLTEIDSGLAMAAQEVISDTVDENGRHMQHAEELEKRLENQVDALNLPKEGPMTITTNPGLEQPVVQDVEDSGRGYASSEDAEGEIDLDLGGMDDDDYDPDTYGQGATHDVTVTPNHDVDAYGESTKKDEAMPLSTSEDVSAEVPDVGDITEHGPTPIVVDDTPEVTPSMEEAKPVSIRRRPGHQRQSPSYNMDAAPSNAIPAPPSFLPARPAMAPEPQAPVRQPFNQIDLSTVTFPEGLNAESPSVQRHPAWVKAWKGGKPYLSPCVSKCSRLFFSQPKGSLKPKRKLCSNSSRPHEMKVMSRTLERGSTNCRKRIPQW